MVNVGKWELDNLVEIKKRREDKALKILMEAKEELKRQEAILEEKKIERAKAQKKVLSEVENLHQDKRSGTTKFKVESRTMYIEKLKDIVLEKEKNIARQKKNVVSAEKNVTEKQKKYSEASREVNKLKEFRKEWAKERKIYLIDQEEKEMDEVGTLMFDHRRFMEEEDNE